MRWWDVTRITSGGCLGYRPVLSAEEHRVVLDVSVRSRGAVTQPEASEPEERRWVVWFLISFGSLDSRMLWS